MLVFFFAFAKPPLFAYENKTVLVLNSYHEGNVWTAQVTKGIKSVLSKSQDVIIHVEYMDTKRFFREDYIAGLDTLYRLKYKSTDIDLIICSDNNALDFIIERFGHPPFTAPVVFCGVSNYQDYKLDTLPFYGITESIKFNREIILFMKLLPQTEHVYYIFDQTKTGNIYYRYLSQQKKKFENIITLHLINDIDASSIAGFISSLPQNSVIRFINTHKDKYGEPLNDIEIAKAIARNANVPVFGGETSLIVDGFLGGLFTRGSNHGQEAGKVGEIILKDSKQEELNKLYFSKPEFYIDYRLMKNFDISAKDLPEGTHVLNGPSSFVYKYRYQVLAVAAFVFFLLFTIFLLIINNTNRKRNQAQLMAAKLKAEESDKLKSAFLANMSHEIRTPLNSIIGFSRLLADKYEYDETAERYISYISSSTESLLNLINDILDISNMEVGQLEIYEKVIDINKELDDLYSIFDHQLFTVKKHDITLIYQPESDDECLMKTDPIRVRQIMSNLITNAIKFTTKGEIVFGYEIKNDYLQFFCIDTGKGIHPHQQEYIFKRFVKINGPEDTNQKGTGLGLSITKNLVELLGGKIWFESEPGIGSSFYFTIPFQK